jgi:hypothetical protein
VPLARSSAFADAGLTRVDHDLIPEPAVPRFHVIDDVEKPAVELA